MGHLLCISLYTILIQTNIFFYVTNTYPHFTLMYLPLSSKNLFFFKSKCKFVASCISISMVCWWNKNQLETPFLSLQPFWTWSTIFFHAIVQFPPWLVDYIFTDHLSDVRCSKSFVSSATVYLMLTLLEDFPPFVCCTLLLFFSLNITFNRIFSEPPSEFKSCPIQVIIVYSSSLFSSL